MMPKSRQFEPILEYLGLGEADLASQRTWQQMDIII